MTKKKTLVLGASSNPERYSYKAVQQLLLHQHPVVAIGNKKGSISHVPIEQSPIDIPLLHTVTLYLNALQQQQYYNYILSQKPVRIIFNPGAENDDLVMLAKQNNIETLYACTLVLLSIGQY